MNKQSGFTLIEMMVATSIVAVIGTMAAVGISSLIDTKERAEAHATANSVQHVSIEQIITDLDNAAVIHQTQTIEWDGKALLITRRAASGGHLQVVAWTTSNSKLFRWNSGALFTMQAWNDAWIEAGTWARSGQLSANQYAQSLMNADNMDVAFWVGNGWANAQSSLTSGAMVNGARINIQTPGGLLTRKWINPAYSEARG